MDESSSPLANVTDSATPRNVFGTLSKHPETVSVTKKMEDDTLPSRPLSPVVKILDESTSQSLPKSRSFNVFTGLTKSLSPSSFMPSRHTNTSSAQSTSSVANGTNMTAVTAPAALADSDLPMPTRTAMSKGSRWSLGSHKSQPEIVRDPCFIYESQPSAYWTGRFMSLHDRFRSEALTPNNMQSIILAHSKRANARNKQPRGRQPHHFLNDASYALYSSIPFSATSAAVLQQTSGVMADAVAHADAALLLNDDERCKRIFVHLEAFCATDEARNSLRLWQMDYARKTGHKKLMPRVTTSRERQVGSYISRIMGGRRIGKRASIM